MFEIIEKQDWHDTGEVLDNTGTDIRPDLYKSKVWHGDITQLFVAARQHQHAMPSDRPCPITRESMESHQRIFDMGVEHGKQALPEMADEEPLKGGYLCQKHQRGSEVEGAACSECYRDVVLEINWQATRKERASDAKHLLEGDLEIITKLTQKPIPILRTQPQAQPDKCKHEYEPLYWFAKEERDGGTLWKCKLCGHVHNDKNDAKPDKVVVEFLQEIIDMVDDEGRWKPERVMSCKMIKNKAKAAIATLQRAPSPKIEGGEAK